jgi:hydrogenase maturation protease
MLVIGYGNTTRRDDGAGWYIAQHLMAHHAPLEAIATHQLTPELADTISHAGFVIFIDACAAMPAGRVLIDSVHGVDDASLVHQMTPAGLLTLAQALYGQSPDALLVTINGRDFGYGEGLSDEVEAACHQVIGWLE